MDDILVEVICKLPDRAPATYNVATPERNTVAGLIRKVCKENGIVVRTSYTLLDKRERVLQWSQTLKNCGIKHNDTVYLTNEDEDSHVHNTCSWNSWWFVAAISLLIGGVGFTAVTLLFTRNGQPQYQYGVVLDAGSSHTTLYVYKWNGEKLDHTAEARQVHECRVQGGGINSYVQNPSDVRDPLKRCLDEVRHIVPVEIRDKTPVFLGATAGMRMLDEVDHDTADEIFFNIRDVLQASAFSFTSPDTQARILTGQEEGTFGWITANYISNKLAGMPPNMFLDEIKFSGQDTIGALDMGGASTQITFYTPQHTEIPADYKEDLVLYGQNYSVYTHSYLCYGINEAIRRYQASLIQDQGFNVTNITNPCGPRGYNRDISATDIFEAPCVKTFTNQLMYNPQDKDAVDNYTFIGTGDEAECVTSVDKLFNFTAPCPVPPCSFNGTYQPHVPVVQDFYAFSSFFYEMDFLNLTAKKHSLDEFTQKLSTLCNASWEEVSKMPAGSNGTMLAWYCFEGHFIQTLLVKAYKFDQITWNNLDFVKKINGTDVGWTLGYMLNSSNTIPDIGPAQYISTTAFSSLTVLFAIFILLAIGFGCYARKYHPSKTAGLYERVPTYGAV